MTDSGQPSSHGSATPDLDAIERDLNAVQSALGRLADDTYWTDEVTGEEIPVADLDANPLLTRRS